MLIFQWSKGPRFFWIHTAGHLVLACPSCSARPHTPAHAATRPHTPAHGATRRHTPAHGRELHASERAGTRPFSPFGPSDQSSWPAGHPARLESGRILRGHVGQAPRSQASSAERGRGGGIRSLYQSEQNREASRRTKPRTKPWRAHRGRGGMSWSHDSNPALQILITLTSFLHVLWFESACSHFLPT